MTRAQENRFAGALAGLAIGDALAYRAAGLPPAQAAPRVPRAQDPLVHGASTTWVLAVLDTLLRRGAEGGIRDELALRLLLLGRPLGGSALRGAAPGASATLRAVASRLEIEFDTRLCGSLEVHAEGVLGVLPLTFALGDADDDVIRALIDIVGLTHRHVRVIGAAALWLGGLRHRVRAPRGDLEEMWPAAQRFANATLRMLRERHAGHLVGHLLEAEGAIAIAIAQARAAHEDEDEGAESLLSPAGVDARDTPERLVCLSLLASDVQRPWDDIGRAADIAGRGGDADVTLPLLYAARGLMRGRDHLPLGWLSRLVPRPWLESRVRALFRGQSAKISPLVEDELRLSLRLRRALSPWPDEPAERPSPRKGEQLKLL